MKTLNESQSDIPKIFESPDGGHTVYSRDIGSPTHERTLYSESGTVQSTREKVLENKLWGEIRRAAKTDPVLQSALDRAIILYQLSKEKYGTK